MYDIQNDTKETVKLDFQQSSSGYRLLFVRFSGDRHLFCEVWSSTDWNMSSSLSAVELGGLRPFAQHVVEPWGSERGDWSNWFYTGVVRGLLTSSQINMGLKLQPTGWNWLQFPPNSWLCPRFSSVMTEQFELSQTPLWAREHWLMLFTHINNAL